VFWCSIVDLLGAWVYVVSGLILGSPEIFVKLIGIMILIGFENNSLCLSKQRASAFVTAKPDG
jgi:hypothetical protein